MHYKGFDASYQYVINVGVYVGELLNIPDVVAFSAATRLQLSQVMIEAVENYLAYCMDGEMGGRKLIFPVFSA